MSNHEDDEFGGNNKARQIEIEAIVHRTNVLRTRFAKIETVLNKTKHVKPTDKELEEHGIGNVTFVNPKIDNEYKMALTNPNLTMLQMLEMFSVWTTQLESLLILNKHRLHHNKVREHLNSIFDTCKIIDVIVRKKYGK